MGKEVKPLQVVKVYEALGLIWRRQEEKKKRKGARRRPL
jgi:hypothetical protein